VCDGRGSSTEASRVPVMSLSCSSLASKLGASYVPSPGPLAQMYGVTDVVPASSSSSHSPTSSTSSMRSSLMTSYSPLKVGGGVSEITAKISAARLCGRQHAVTMVDGPRAWSADCGGDGTTGCGGLRAADSRSTSWLSSVPRPTSVVPVLTHWSSISGSLAAAAAAANRSVTPSRISRSSSLMSNDSSTLRTSTLVPDNSRKSFTVLTFHYTDCDNYRPTLLPVW